MTPLNIASPHGLIRHRDAIFIPGVGTRFFDSQLVDAIGAPIPAALTGMKYRRTPTKHRDLADLKVEHTLTGTHYFGGIYFSHFGHYITDTISRFYGLDHVPDPIDSMLFFGRKQMANDALPFPEINARLGVTHPVRWLSGVTRIENLYVAPQGMGLGNLAAGLPAARAYLREKFSAGVAPGSQRRVYISRMGYKYRRGGMIGEDVLERNLIAQGYAIARPETMTLEDQLSLYRGASHLICADSSALHLAAYVMEPHQQIAIIERRKKGARDVAPQLAAFTGRPPLVIDAITGMVTLTGHRLRKWAASAICDFDAIKSALMDAGFVSDTGAWDSPSHDELAELARVIAADAGGAISDSQDLRPQA